MRVLELSLRNYRVFEKADLELPARVIGIFGPNGSGKSALVEAILYGLYGRARTGKKEIRTQGVLTDCEVRIVFEHAGKQYEVRRAIKGRGNQPEAELLAGDLQLASGVSEVDAEVARLLHMDHAVFRASVFAEQKQLDAFSDMRKGERKEMVLRLLGIRPVDDARTAARKGARDAKQTAEQLGGAVADVKQLEAALKEAKESAKAAKEIAKAAAEALRVARAKQAEAKKAFAEAERTREKVEKIAVALEAGVNERDRLAAQREELAARIEQRGKELARLPNLEKERASLEGIDERLRAAERLVEEQAKLALAEKRLVSLPEADLAGELRELAEAEKGMRAAQKRLADAEAAAAREEEEVEAAEERVERAAEADPTQPCPTCGQELGSGFARYVKHCKEERAAAKKKLTAVRRRLREARAEEKRAVGRSARAANAAEKSRGAAERRGRLRKDADELRANAKELARAFRGRAPDPGALRAGAARRRELGEQIAELGVEKKRLAEAEEDLEKVETQLAGSSEGIRKLAAEVEHLSFDPKEYEHIHASHREAEEELEHARDAERDAADALNDAQVRVSGIDGEIKQAKETAARVDELRQEARCLERVSLLLDAFRDHLVARIGPELSREAEALFRELTGHEYEDLRIDEETLAITVADGDTYFGLERFSGSENDLANLALRVAISMHLSRMSGADVGMMVLDEVFGALDAERKDLMVRTLGGLAGRFHQLFLITHAEQVKDQFPASIELRRVGRRRSVAELV